MMRCRATRHQDLPAAGHLQAQRFVEGWVQAWNAHDVDAVLDRFADDAVFSSPVAAQLLDGSDGVLHGKSEIRAYWLRGVELIPDLHFAVVGVYVGLTTVVINCRNQKGGLVNES